VNALERIKEIEMVLKDIDPEKHDIVSNYLIKSFNIMREIAIKYIRVHNGYGCEENYPLSLGSKDCDEMFEENMK